jgi:hypothetical protein
MSSATALQLHLTPVFQLVRLAAGGSLKVRLLLQSAELVPISLMDAAEGGRMHSLVTPRLILKSEDGKTEIEILGTWQLGETGSFCTCAFQLVKAGKYLAGSHSLVPESCF